MTPKRAPTQALLRVLHVEDNPLDVLLSARQLEQAGFDLQADVVAAPHEFLEKIRSKEYDVILSDYNLAGWSGMDALEMLQSEGKDIPFILLTGTIGEMLAVECMQKGVTDFILKDRPGRLPLAIHRALDQKRLRDDRRRVEQSRALLALIVESSRDAIIGETLDGTIASWNRAAELTYGYSEQEALGMPLAKLSEACHSSEISHTLEALRRGETVEPYEIKGVRKDGEVIDVSVTISAIRDERGEAVGASVIARDISAQKRLEQELFQAQKMEAVGRLAAGVAHDFNNLLTVIAAYSALAMEEVEEDSVLYQQIHEISRAGERAASLTRQLLAFSRKQVVRTRPLDINAVVADMENMVRRVLGAEIKLETRLAPVTGMVNADPGQIEQIVLNLAVNARDAMPEGGRLMIDTALTHRDGSTHGRPWMMLAVTDTGTGMDARTLARIFEPFFTTKPLGQGTGLGLATVYGIVKQTGGDIRVESEPGRGASFQIYLPCVSEGAAKPEPAAAPEAAGNETVLVVEDEEVIRVVIVSALRKLGYTVLEAANGADALALYERQDGPVDMLISDLVMPAMGGCELAARLTALHTEMKVLFVSGYADAALIKDASVWKDAGFLQKPFRLATLTAKVRETLDR